MIETNHADVVVPYPLGPLAVRVRPFGKDGGQEWIPGIIMASWLGPSQVNDIFALFVHVAYGDGESMAGEVNSEWIRWGRE